MFYGGFVKGFVSGEGRDVGCMAIGGSWNSCGRGVCWGGGSPGHFGEVSVLVVVGTDIDGVGGCSGNEMGGWTYDREEGS